MKKLLASLVLLSSVAVAQTPEYSVKYDKEVVIVTETKGTVIILPRAPVTKEVVDGTVVYFSMAQVQDMLVVLGVTDKMCNAGKGQIGVIAPDGSALLAMVDFDSNAKHKSPAFVAEFICKSGQGKLKPTTDKPLKGPVNKNVI